jgi:hypothetical protein
MELASIQPLLLLGGFGERMAACSLSEQNYTQI